jgi:flagellin
MIIGHNIQAYNTHRQLSMNNSKATKSIEKLSTGLRINKAGDDAAGLAISEKMRGQVRGLNQASRNAQDAISLIQTAEGAASEVHSMLQRVRELTIQAANGTLTDKDRNSLNDEVIQLKSQVDTIASNTEFNTIKMLDGEMASSTGTILTGVSQAVVDTLKAKIPLWIDDALKVMEINYGITLPASRSLTVTLYQDGAASAPAATMGTSDGGATLQMQVNVSKLLDGSNQIPVGTSGGQFDTVIAHEIMHAMQFTAMSDMIAGGFTTPETWFAEGLATIVQGGSGFIAPPNNSASVNLLAWTGTTAEYGSAFAAIKTLHEITVGGINAIIDQLEAGNSLDAAINATAQTLNGDPALTTADGVNPQVDFANFADFVTWFNTSTDVNNYLDNSTDFVGSGAIVDGSDPTSSFNGTSADTIVNDDTVDYAGVYSIAFADVSGDSDSNGKVLNFQIGANTGQSMQFNSANLTTQGLGLGNLDISTQDNAASAIQQLDSAITKVSSVRGRFGSYQNRLEHTILNLVNTSENLTSSEARIRDTDMAQEMAQLSKNNILAQASQAMLSQANQIPQGVLQLLKG